jgi:cytoplasmic tRNA 2-thiolation protein 2
MQSGVWKKLRENRAPSFGLPRRHPRRIFRKMPKICRAEAEGTLDFVNLLAGSFLSPSSFPPVAPAEGNMDLETDCFKMPAKDINQLCRRCGESEAAITVRTEPLCRDCFFKYVRTKVVKRLEAFRTRNLAAGQKRTLLLPMSFGLSSTVLLHILDQHMQRQRQNTHRTGFALHILHIDCDTDGMIDAPLKYLDPLRAKYPEHKYSSISLADIFEEAASSPENPNPNKNENLEDLFSRLSSASSKSDVLSLLRTRLAVSFAKENLCEGILWGDSTTKLAEKVLAETAKGRGFSLSWQVADGQSPYGITFYYPLRDVLKKELLPYAQLVDPPLLPLINQAELQPTQAPPSAKNTTIDALMKQYFESVEENYPSIVSNVVRTSGKLQALPTEGTQLCRLCKMPVEQELMGIHGWAGDQTLKLDRGEQNSSRLCYGCSRAVPEDAISLLPP